MTDKEFFIHTLKDEFPRFERILKAVEKIPVKKHSYRPHKKSRTTLELLMNTFGSESDMMIVFLKKDGYAAVDWHIPKWKTARAIRMAFTKNMKIVLEIVGKMSNSKWKAKASMFVGDKMNWETSRGMMAWGFLLDLIHHRGQLSTYLRPMGGIVPSIYGPSADSK